MTPADLDEIRHTWRGDPAAFVAGPEPRRIRDLFTRPAWHADAACRGMAHQFFLERGAAATAAKAICAGCPVVAPCLDEALATAEREDYGIRGGTTRGERNAMRREGAR